jgi:hypothetical protein
MFIHYNHWRSSRLQIIILFTGSFRFDMRLPPNARWLEISLPATSSIAAAQKPEDENCYYAGRLESRLLIASILPEESLP